MNDTPTQAQRQAVTKRAAGFCEYCRSSAKYGVQSFECEHIIPISKGGLTNLDNLAFACGGCNRCKSARVQAYDVDSEQSVNLFHPRQQEWPEHFAWSHDFTMMVGMTAIGRATIKALRLNRPGVVNLRRALLLVGEHPPKT